MKIPASLKNLIKAMGQKNGKTQMISIRNVKVNIIRDSIDIQRVIRQYYEQIHVNKFDDWGEKKFLETNSEDWFKRKYKT